MTPSKAVILGFIAGLIPAAGAMADEVHLSNGDTLVGIARHEPGTVVVETGLGTLTFPQDKVKSIEPGRTALHEYQERIAELGVHPKADSVFALAQWAEAQGLTRYVNHLLQWTIQIDPNHAEARRLLDYVMFEGTWMPAHERVERLRAQSEVINRADSIRRARETRAQVRKGPPRSLPEMSPGYVYFGIPPGPPPRGTENHGDYGGYYGNMLLTFPQRMLIPLVPGPATTMK
jgi:hypothetical protein